MNAGAYGTEAAEVLDWAEVATPRGVERLPAAAFRFAYRHAALPGDAVVIRARLRARPGRREDIAARMAEIRASREETQPVRARTGGSTFKNPPGGRKAWELIDAAGCRGLRRGAAQVSEKHCNFLLNTGGATAAELEALGEEVRARVLARSGDRAGMGDQAHRHPRGCEGRAMTKRVALLHGGISAEREVSLASGRQCIAALREAGFAVEPIDVTGDLGALLAALREARPDVVFNTLHGRFGEDGCIQGVLDWLGLPYTGSGLRASALAMDKPAAKALFAAAGLPVVRAPPGHARRAGSRRSRCRCPTW